MPLCRRLPIPLCRRLPIPLCRRLPIPLSRPHACSAIFRVCPATGRGVVVVFVAAKREKTRIELSKRGNHLAKFQLWKHISMASKSLFLLLKIADCYCCRRKQWRHMENENVVTQKYFAPMPGRGYLNAYTGNHNMFTMNHSVTRLGDFWNIPVTNFLTKVAQLLGNFLGFFEKHCLQVKTNVATFWITFGIISATFYVNIWSHWLRYLQVSKCCYYRNVIYWDFVNYISLIATFVKINIWQRRRLGNSFPSHFMTSRNWQRLKESVT